MDPIAAVSHRIVPPDPSIADAVGTHHELATALADLVDNAIDADARRVHIRFLTRGGTLTDLLVMDEPTVGLDPVTREELWTTFHALASQGATLLVSSHVMDEAFRCDQVLLMRQGRILATTTAKDLLAGTGADTVDAAFLAVIADSEKQSEQKGGLC